MFAFKRLLRSRRAVRRVVRPTGRERRFPDDEIIVTKTDLKGRITYANEVFLAVAGFREEEVIGQPHSIIRHPDMPRCLFQVMWETIQKGEEIFAYVLNLCKNGDHYWVLAHITPTFDHRGRIQAYHSNRRTAPERAVRRFADLYRELKAIEDRHRDRKRGLAAARERFDELVGRLDVSFNEWVLKEGG